MKNQQYIVKNIEELNHFTANFIKTYLLASCELIQKNQANSAIIIFLEGTLGVGKTAFVKSFFQYFNYQKPIKSPSYGILNSYDLKSDDLKNDNFSELLKYIDQIHHFDAYRIQSIEQWHDYGFEDCFKARQLCLIEWPENCQEAISEPHIKIQFNYIENNERLIKIEMKTT